MIHAVLEFPPDRSSVDDTWIGKDGNQFLLMCGRETNEMGLREAVADLLSTARKFLGCFVHAWLECSGKQVWLAPLDYMSHQEILNELCAHTKHSTR